MSMIGKLLFFCFIHFSIRKGYIHFPDQVCKGNLEQVQDGRFKTIRNTYGYQM